MVVTCYISGPMTGVVDYEDAFAIAEKRLTERNLAVYNPAWQKFGADWEYTDILKIDLAILMQCDIVYMLRGWHKSKGAVAEHDLAIALGKHIIYEEDGWEKTLKSPN